MQCHLVARLYICELCNAILLQGITYVNYAMPCCLAKPHICELYHDIIFYYVLNLSTILVHSITLPVHQPFGTVMEKSGVETWSSEQTMLSDEAHVLLLTDSSSEEDSETDDQSYIPPEVYALSCNVYISHMMHMVSCIA